MGSAAVLIVEDDEFLRTAMKEAFEKKSLGVLGVATATEALQVLNTESVEYVFLDCFLPGSSGDQLAIKIKQEFANKKIKVILMSGIYTDKSSIQELLKTTQASAFIKKPFDLEQVIQLVQKKSTESDSPRKILYQTFSKDLVSTREKRKIIESIEKISGFDLPFIYSLLTESKSSGYLNIYFNDSSVSGISFSNGCIVGVDIEDKSTYIGEMLIQGGFVSPEDIQKALQTKNNQRLGQRLISSNLMSPHALDMTMIEQMNVRLSKTITEKNVKLSFAASEVELTQPCIDSDILLNYLNDWIASKIPINWLKSLYAMWSGHLIIPTSTFKMNHPAMGMNLVMSLPGLDVALQQKNTLNSLLNKPEYNHTALYKALHFLLTKGLIYFSKEIYFQNESEHIVFLQKLQIQLKDKNNFEILQALGLSQFTSKELAKEEIKNLIGVQPNQNQIKILKIWMAIHNKISQAIDSINSEDKKKMEQDAEKNESANRLKASQLVEEARKDLLLNEFSKALEKLKEAGRLSSNIFQLNIFLAWAKLGKVMGKKDRELVKEIEMDLMQVSPDERYDSLYPYVMGLYYKSKNDLLNAKKSFDKSLAMDSTFISARRELSIVEMLIKKNKKNDNIFTMDLKDFVTVLFNKK
ncbi:MAG: response regulator [Deltaproteobacteria bacterium]|nr:response regulator [Deltaproteobacteria bacterium]